MVLALSIHFVIRFVRIWLHEAHVCLEMFEGDQNYSILKIRIVLLAHLFLWQNFCQNPFENPNRLKIHIRWCKWTIFYQNTSSDMNFQTIWMPKVLTKTNSRKSWSSRTQGSPKWQKFLPKVPWLDKTLYFWKRVYPRVFKNGKIKMFRSYQKE